MARRIELGAGIAAAVLSVITLIVILFAPIVSSCSGGTLSHCPAGHQHNESLLQLGIDGSVWAYLIGMVVVLIAGGAGAVAEARYGWRGGVALLWGGAVLAFAACALTAGGIGLLYLPSVLAVCLAAYASILQRMAARRARSAEPKPQDDPQK